ncbi:MAG: hypothetical protein ABIG61_00325, partial [Planctomycetota bacterium]
MKSAVRGKSYPCLKITTVGILEVDPSEAKQVFVTGGYVMLKRKLFVTAGILLTILMLSAGSS